MRRPTLLAICLLLAACTPARFDIVQAPSGRTTDQQQLDATQCTRKNRVYGPWLLGLGSAALYNQAENGYRACMNAMGYTVREQE